MNLDIKVGKLKGKELKRFYEEVILPDPVAQEYRGRRSSFDIKLRDAITKFHLFVTKAQGRNPWEDPFTPTEFRDLRRAERGDKGSHLQTYRLIMSFMEYLRHTCIQCGAWIDKNPRDYGIVPCDNCDGGTYAPNTRNAKVQDVRGFLRNTAGSSPFGEGDNFWEWGENVTVKHMVSLEDIRRLEQAGNDLQRVLLGGWLCTGMSGDLIKLRVTEDLLQQLEQDPLPDLVLFPWYRGKTKGKQERSLRKRYVGYVGIWVQHLAAWVRKKGLKPGDPLFPGHNGERISKNAVQKSWQNLKKKAGIKDNGELFTPHVLRGYCFSTFVSVADHYVAKYITGKKCDKSIVVYYNSHLFEPGPDGKSSLADIYRKAKAKLDPYAAEREEAEILRRQQEGIDEKLRKLEAELRARDELILEMREQLRELRRAQVKDPAKVIVEEENPLEAARENGEIQKLMRIIEEQQRQIQELRQIVLARA